MRVSVILVAFYSDSWLPTCLATFPDSASDKLHLVLVDNSGNTTIPNLDLSQFDTEVLCTPHSLGFAEANNFALLNASHLEDIILFLNQDTISMPGWIDRCLDAFRKDERLGAISPFIRTYDGTGWDPSFLACIGPEETWGEGELIYRDRVPAPALLIRKDVLFETGPFDPVFGSYYEDYDLCRRIREAGYRIGFCRSAEIHHFSGSSTDTPERERKRQRMLLRNRLLFHQRERGDHRLSGLLNHLFMDLPVRLVRGLLRTSSSQPPIVVLRAQRDLLHLFGRLLSRKTDEKHWKGYLKKIGWPEKVPGCRVNSLESAGERSV